MDNGEARDWVLRGVGRRSGTMLTCMSTERQARREQAVGGGQCRVQDFGDGSGGAVGALRWERRCASWEGRVTLKAQPGLSV